MAWDGSGSVHALRLRVTRLNADGSAMAGASNRYTTSTLIEVSSTLSYEDGDEITQKNGGGEVCLSYKEPDVLTGTEMKMSLCSPDPELTELLLGGSVLLTSGSAIGYAAPAVGSVGAPNGVAVEAWSRLVLNGSGTGSYLHWLWPKTIWRADERKLAAEGYVNALTGTGYENANLAGIPDWTWPTTRVEQYTKTSTLPVSALGYQTVPTS